ncbi:MAG TPA: hypothetical protein VEB86_03785 [Chryseosolibacter sp.]|nr:hypothetical protein [Chryseosolibacter sp.]
MNQIGRHLKLVCAVAIQLCFLFPSAAQDQPTPPAKPARVEIIKTDDSVLRGQLLGVKRDTATFRNDQGIESRIPMNEIRKIDYAVTKRSDYWHDSPNALRYLISPTAWPLEQGEVLWHNTYLILNSIQVGVSDDITIGGGADVFSGNLFFFNAKAHLLSKPTYKFSIALNYFHLPEDFLENVAGDDLRDLGMVYGLGTWGNSNHHFTVGAGYLILKSELLPPIVSVGGTTRFTKNFALVTENWFLFVGQQHVDVPVIISAGIRYIGERSSVDVAFYGDHEFSGEIAIPYFSYSIRLGDY